MKTVLIVMLMSIIALVACSSDARVASKNISAAADNFEVERRVVFFNGITDTYLLSIEGRCSIYEDRGTSGIAQQLEVTCKTGPDKYMKHFLGLSDNVSYFAEQLYPEVASQYRYRVVFRPTEIIPDVRVGG